jgi:hypothetical protein
VRVVRLLQQRDERGGALFAAEVDVDVAVEEVAEAVSYRYHPPCLRTQTTAWV